MTMGEDPMIRQQARARVRIPAGGLVLSMAACAGTAEPPDGTVDRCAGLAVLGTIAS